MGLKVRDIYEAPAATILLTAHQELERLVCTIHQNQFKPQLDRQWAYLVYAGLWWEPLRTTSTPTWTRSTPASGGTIGAYRLFQGPGAGHHARPPKNAVYDPALALLLGVRGLFSQSASPGLHRAVLAAVADGLATALSSITQGMERPPPTRLSGYPSACPKWYLRELLPSRRRVVLSLAACPRRRRNRRRAAAQAGRSRRPASASRPCDAPSACGLTFKPRVMPEERTSRQEGERAARPGAQ